MRCPEPAFGSLCQLNSCWRPAHYQFFFLSFDQYFWLFCPHRTRTTSVSMRTPIYLHLADGHVGFVPELSCWESLCFGALVSLCCRGDTREDKRNQIRSKSKGRMPLSIWSRKHPLLFPKGLGKEDRDPGAAHLAS